MNQYHEDVAWQRLVDIQREMENSRLWADSMPSLLDNAVKAGPAGLDPGRAPRRAPRKRPLRVRRELR
jgi:hypothetical protein